MRSSLPLLFALSLTPAVVYAQPRPNPNAPMSAEAAAHYEVAGRFYGVRRFDDAAREFQTAYALSGRPELLFNIGRAFEDGQHYPQALDAYEHFLRDGHPGVDRSTVEARVAAVRRAQALVRAQTPVVTPPPRPLVAPVATPPPRVTPPVTPAPAPSRALPLSLLIGGGVALSSALILGATLINTDAELAAACTNGVCPSDRARDISGGHTRALVADVLGGLGLAAITAGVVLWIVQTPTPAPTPRRTTLHFDCGPSSCSAGAEVRF